MADLLYKVKGALLQARESGASLAVLTAFLRECGIPVSEATLRQYVRAQGGSKKLRRKTAGTSVTEPTAAPQLHCETKVRMETQAAQRRIEENRAGKAPAGHDPFAPREREPRIADPKNV